MNARLCLTCDEAAAGYLKRRYRLNSHRPNVIPLSRRLVRVPIGALHPILMPVAASERNEDRTRSTADAPTNAELVNLYREADGVDFYVDPDPNSQLLMMLFLTELRASGLDHRKLHLLNSPAPWGKLDAGTPPNETAPPVLVDAGHLDLATTVWTAYCASTPLPWLALDRHGTGPFPFLDDAVEALLDDLPRKGTGLGSSDLLAMTTIGLDGASVDEVARAFHREPMRLTDLSQIADLIGSLAAGERPLVHGWPEQQHGRNSYPAAAWDAVRRCRLGLTELGRRVFRGELDLVETHGIDRWWGGTHLVTNRCWRWDRETRTLAISGDRGHGLARDR